METLKAKTKAAVVQIAKWQIGFKEFPANSNKTKYGAWYGLDGQPWCVMFIQWVFHEAGFSLFRTASCTALLNRYMNVAPQQVIRSNYQVGDLVLFDFSGKKKVTEHIGIVVDVSSNGKTVVTIEGNTSINGSQNNGGEVLLRTRSVNLISAAIRPNYPD